MEGIVCISTVLIGLMCFSMFGAYRNSQNKKKQEWDWYRGWR